MTAGCRFLPRETTAGVLRCWPPHEDTATGLSETIRDWWFASVGADLKAINATLRRLERDMATGEEQVQAGIKRVGDQVDLAIEAIHAGTAEIRRLTEVIAAHVEVDLTEEVAALNKIADDLDAAAPDGPAEPPVAPV